jgi:hypothetical protein
MFRFTQDALGQGKGDVLLLHVFTCTTLPRRESNDFHAIFISERWKRHTARPELQKRLQKQFVKSARKQFLEKTFSLQLANEAVVVELLGFGLGGFGAGPRPLFQDKFEHVRVKVGNAFDDVDAELPTGFETLGIIGPDKPRDR